MSIKTPREDMEKQSNNTFQMETVVNPASYGVGDKVGCLEFGTSQEYFGETSFYTGNWVEQRFRNPTDKEPMKVSEFLSKLNLSQVLHVAKERYGNKHWHYRFPTEAMFKALVFKHLKGLRWDTELVRYLENYPDDARLLGFLDVNGNVKIPKQQTFSHFVNARIRNEGFYDLFDCLIIAIKEQLEVMGYKLGRTISIDSTPFKSFQNDPDGKYNPHYEIKGYKIHGAIDADFYLPLAFNFTTAIEGDSPHYLPLLDRIRMMGMEFEKVLADGAYASLENFAVVNQYYKARTVFNLRENARIRPEGTHKGILRKYHKLWDSELYEPNAGLDYMLSFLLHYERASVVGAHYYNKHIREWAKDPDGLKLEYNKRAGIEAFHGHMKENMLLEKNLNKRGIQRAEIHVLLCYISLLCVALCRLQHGVTTGLVNVKCLV